MSMLSTSLPPSSTSFKRILVHGMEWTWDTQLEKAMCYAWRSWARSHGDSNESIQHDATTSVRATFNDTPSQFDMPSFGLCDVALVR
nr:hypothetical protein [Tanacetum cinerariifolium]